MTMSLHLILYHVSCDRVLSLFFKHMYTQYTTITAIYAEIVVCDHFNSVISFCDSCSTSIKYTF